MVVEACRTATLPQMREALRISDALAFQVNIFQFDFCLAEVTGRMWKNKPPFRLMLNSKAANEIHWHCEHYKGRGVMKSSPILFLGLLMYSGVL